MQQLPQKSHTVILFWGCDFTGNNQVVLVRFSDDLFFSPEQGPAPGENICVIIVSGIVGPEGASVNIRNIDGGSATG